MSESELYDFLARHRLGVLGSTYNESPQAALIGIAVSPRLEIIFDTIRDTRKYRNLTVRSACSLVIGWEGEQTVQYEGQASELIGPDLPLYQEIYFQMWPNGRDRVNWPGLVYFAVRPKWIRFSGYDQRPPFIQEWQF